MECGWGLTVDLIPWGQKTDVLKRDPASVSIVKVHHYTTFLLFFPRTSCITHTHTHTHTHIGLHTYTHRHAHTHTHTDTHTHTHRHTQTHTPTQLLSVSAGHTG